MEGVGLISGGLFFWVEPLVRSAFKRELTADESLKVPLRLQPAELYKRFEVLLSAEIQATSPLDVAALHRIFRKLLGRDVALAVALQGIAVLLKFANVLVLRRAVQLITVGGEDKLTEGVILASALCLVSAFDSMFATLATLRLMMALWGTLGCFSQAVLRKGSRLHPAVQDKFRRGDLVTLALSDLNRIVEMSSIIMQGLSAPMLLVTSLVFLIALFGPIVLVVVFPIAAMMSVVRTMGKMQGGLFRKKMMAQGQRLGIVNEMLQSVRFAKYYTLEEHYQKEVERIRKNELASLQKMKLVVALNWPIAGLVPIMTAAVVLCAKMIADGSMPNTADTMAMLAAIRILYYPFAFFGGALGGFNMYAVAVGRVAGLLQQPEISRRPCLLDSDTDAGAAAVSIRNMNFSWSCDAAVPPTLKSINLEIPRGEFWAIVGPLGSGKSSLLNAILGGMSEIYSDDVAKAKGNGVVTVASSRTYVAQEPMVVNASVKGNIAFGLPLSDEEAASGDSMYRRAIEVSALGPDLDVLPAGDETEIGEKGITLSGGQKARVALARAVFSTQPGGLVLLDDPLAAVDAHVGAHIFNRCVVEALAKTTRILVTNQIHFLNHSEVSKILVMEDGRIVETGTYAELANDVTSRFSKMLATQGAAHKEAEQEDVAEKEEETWKTPKIVDADEKRKSASLTGVEAKREGAVTWAAVRFYIQNLGGYPFFILLAMSSWFFHLSEIAPDLFLALWQDDILPDREQHVYLVIWMVVSFLGVCSVCATRSVWSILTTWAARRVHGKMFARVLHCPTSFFDRTPSGRIMNRHGEDQMLVDWSLPLFMEIFFIAFFICLDIFVLAIVSRPWVAPFVVLFVCLALCIREVHRRANRNSMRWWMITKSPLFNTFEEILSGVTTIYAFGREDIFYKRFEEAMLVNVRWLMSKESVNLWMEQRLAFAGSIFVGVLAVNMIFLKSNVSDSLCTISVIYCLQLGFHLKTLVYFLVQTDGCFTSVERISEFSETLEQEPPWCLPADEGLSSKSWPSTESELVFEKVSIRYRPHLPRALDELSVTIAPCEKVGIVGRTGSGKSTLVGAIFRLFPLDGGRVTLGGVDLASIGLQHLRRQVTIVPQDPILFSGPLRKNLDPIGRRDDAELWGALRRCHLAELVQGLKGGLDAAVKDGGSNFSVGERQVLCLARALVRNSRVLCLDEATANVDPVNDRRIQCVLAGEVQECMVLTIAHRLHTVLASDRILVLERGRLGQFDSPEALLQTPGLFRDLATAAGISLASLQAVRSQPHKDIEETEDGQYTSI